MNIIADTERLIIRLIELPDVNPLLTIWNQPQVSWTTHISWSRESLLLKVKKSSSDFDSTEQISCGIVLKQIKQVIGSISLGIDSTRTHAELGYLVDEKFWGHGYATEAAMAMLQFAFDWLKLDYIFACVATCNARSIRLLEKIGMHQKHMKEKSLNLQGHIYDAYRYEIRAPMVRNT